MVSSLRQVCADRECKVRTDLCGTIARDDKTIEQFMQFQQRQASMSQVNTAPFTSLGASTPNFNTIGGGSTAFNPLQTGNPVSVNTDLNTGTGSTSTGLF